MCKEQIKTRYRTRKSNILHSKMHQLSNMETYIVAKQFHIWLTRRYRKAKPKFKKIPNPTFPIKNFRQNFQKIFSSKYCHQNFQVNFQIGFCKQKSYQIYPSIKHNLQSNSIYGETKKHRHRFSPTLKSLK